jgi:hypothetical protein
MSSLVHFADGPGTFLFIAAAFLIDWVRFSSLRNYAAQNGLGVISMNPFAGYMAAERVAASLPKSPFRTRVRGLVLASMACWLVYAGFIFFALWMKH